MQHEMRMHPIVICGLPSCTKFSTLSHKGRIFEKKVIEYFMPVLIFSTNLSETFLILRRNERDMIKTVYQSSCKVGLPSGLVTF